MFLHCIRDTATSQNTGDYQLLDQIELYWILKLYNTTCCNHRHSRYIFLGGLSCFCPKMALLNTLHHFFLNICPNNRSAWTRGRERGELHSPWPPSSIDYDCSKSLLYMFANFWYSIYLSRKKLTGGGRVWLHPPDPLAHLTMIVI